MNTPRIVMLSLSALPSPPTFPPDNAFGRYVAQQREQSGARRPETFDFWALRRPVDNRQR